MTRIREYEVLITPTQALPAGIILPPNLFCSVSSPSGFAIPGSTDMEGLNFEQRVNGRATKPDAFQNLAYWRKRSTLTTELQQVEQAVRDQLLSNLQLDSNQVIVSASFVQAFTI